MFCTLVYKISLSSNIENVFYRAAKSLFVNPKGYSDISALADSLKKCFEAIGDGKYQMKVVNLIKMQFIEEKEKTKFQRMVVTSKTSLDLNSFHLADIHLKLGQSSVEK